MRALLLLPLTALALAGCGTARTSAAPGAIERAEIALRKQDARTARIELLNAVEATPQNGRAHLLLGRTYLALGEGVAAEAELRRATSLGVKAGEVHHLLAQALLLQNKPASALQEAAAAPPPYRAEALRITGQAQATQGDVHAAEASLRSSIALAPDQPAGWTDLGRVRLAAGDIASATKSADKALALDPRFAPAMLLHGDVAVAARDFTTGQRWYDRALALDHDNIEALIGRATIEGESGRMQALLATTRRIIALSPSNPSAWQLQARLAATSGRFDLARALLAKGGPALEDDASAMQLAGVIEYRSGNYEQAIERLDKLVSKDPNNLRARRILAAAKWGVGDVPGTIDALRPVADRPNASRDTLLLMARALEKQSGSAAARAYASRAALPDPRAIARQVVAGDKAIAAAKWADAVRIYEGIRVGSGDRDAAILNNLAWAYFNLGAKDRALPLAERALKIAPDNASVIDTYAWLLFGTKGDHARALQLLQTASTKAPGNAAIKWHLAQVLAAAGDTANARVQAEAALAIPTFRDREAAQAMLRRI